MPVVYCYALYLFCVCQFEEGELKSIISAQREDGTSEHPPESEVNHNNSSDLCLAHKARVFVSKSERKGIDILFS